MLRQATVTLAILLMLAGCSRVAESRFNPLNWFGGASEEARAASVVPDVPADGRRLIQQVVSLRIERTPGGAIVHATGLPERQAYYDAELVPVAGERAIEGVLEYQFRISPPTAATPSGPPQSREVVVARFVTEQTLAGVRTIRVVGATNALVTRR